MFRTDEMEGERRHEKDIKTKVSTSSTCNYIVTHLNTATGSCQMSRENNLLGEMMLILVRN